MHTRRGIHKTWWRKHLATDGHIEAMNLLRQEAPPRSPDHKRRRRNHSTDDGEATYHHEDSGDVDMPEENAESANVESDFEESESDIESDGAVWDEDDEESGDIWAQPEIEYALGSASQSNFYPYESDVMAYLDMLDNLPRHKIPNRVMEFVIAILKKCGVLNVPSLKKLRQVQKSLAEQHGIRQHKFDNPNGDDLYINDPRDIVMADWANPSVRKRMHLYPEHDCSGKPPSVSEIWHGDRWQRLPDESLPPMIIHPETHKHFYVGEVCQTKSGELIVPSRWLSEKATGELLAKARTVENDEPVSTPCAI